MEIKRNHLIPLEAQYMPTKLLSAEWRALRLVWNVSDRPDGVTSSYMNGNLTMELNNVVLCYSL
jgi:hypothetical protein